MLRSLFKIISLALLVSSAQGQNLSVGKTFPEVVFPSVETGEKISFSSLVGEKMMLHLFASW